MPETKPRRPADRIKQGLMEAVEITEALALGLAVQHAGLIIFLPLCNDSEETI